MCVIFPIRPQTQRHCWQRLFDPVDCSSLVVFRILFGAIMVWEVCRYFSKDWIRKYYIAPDFHFKYYGFSWVEAWSGDGMYWQFAALGVLALLLTVGFLYRATAVLFFLAFTYVFLLDQTRYLNHFYLTSLLLFLLAIIPAHRGVSVDARLWSGLRGQTVPRWSVWLLRFQIGLVYSYAAVAKMNPDWLRGEPMGMWLAERSDYPILGELFVHEWAGYVAAYSSLAFDLMITPLMLMRRTRLIGFVWAVSFHLMNVWLFSIGIFPWMAIVATTVFFEPGWPRRIIPWLSRAERPESAPRQATPRLRETAIKSFLALWVALQTLVPLRHFLYPGNVNWTEEGHRFAWHMKLRDKSSRIELTATDSATGKDWKIDLSEYLTRKQKSKMSRRPDMVVQIAKHIAADYEEQGVADIGITSRVMVSLNGRRRQLLIDPEVDLTKVERSLAHKKWLVPLTEPLR